MSSPHQEQPNWFSLDGKTYCNAYELHGSWVHWPCPESEEEST